MKKTQRSNSFPQYSKEHIFGARLGEVVRDKKEIDVRVHCAGELETPRSHLLRVAESVLYIKIKEEKSL